MKSWSSSKRVSLFLMVLLLSQVRVGWANNLFVNGDFEGQEALPKYFIASNPNHAKCSIYKEADGNRCLKFTVVCEDKYGEVSVTLVVGGAQGVDAQLPGNAIILQPGKKYDFSFDITGIVKPTSVRFYAWPKNDPGGYYHGRKMLNVDILDEPEDIAGKPGWKRYTGELTFPADMHYFSLRIGFYGPKDTYILGPDCFSLVDNFLLTEQQ